MSPRGSGQYGLPDGTEQGTYVNKEADQAQRDEHNRRLALTWVLQHSSGTIDLVELTEMLGLGQELDELAELADAAQTSVTSDRRRQLDEVRLQLGVTEDEIEDRRA